LDEPRASVCTATANAPIFPVVSASAFEIASHSADMGGASNGRMHQVLKGHIRHSARLNSCLEGHQPTNDSRAKRFDVCTRTKKTSARFFGRRTWPSTRGLRAFREAGNDTRRRGAGIRKPRV